MTFRFRLRHRRIASDLPSRDAASRLLYGDAASRLLYGDAASQLPYRDAASRLLYREAASQPPSRDAASRLLYGGAASRLLYRGAAMLLGLSVAACTAGGTTAPPITSVNPTSPTYSKLQFAVGTANVYGTALGLNVVSTLRQTSGASAIGVSTPTLSGPFTFAVGANTGGAIGGDPYATLGDPFSVTLNAATMYPAPSGTSLTVAAGPSQTEVSGASSVISGTPQTVHVGAPYCDALPCPGGGAPNTTTFGQSGGVFAMGFFPGNAVAETGQAHGYAPYAQPFYETVLTRTFEPWGGPPAFDPNHDGMGTRDGLDPLGVDALGAPFGLGVNEGITLFEGVTPGLGSYSLGVAVGTIGSGGVTAQSILSARAVLRSLTLLPALTAPLVTPDGTTGGASLTFALPPGMTEALVQIVDYGPGAGPRGAYANPAAITPPPPLVAANCQGPKGTAFAPVYYTVLVKQSGAYTLSPSAGPNINLTGGKTGVGPSASLCTAAQNIAANVVDASSNPVTSGDNFTVQVIGFDYPAYEAALSVTASGVQAPPIVGAAGQADISVSVPVEEDWTPGGYTLAPLSTTRRPAARIHRKL